MIQHKHKTLLVRVFGFFRDESGKYWMLMNNVMRIEFNFIYDLKGSSTGRDDDKKIGDVTRLRKDINWVRDGGNGFLTEHERVRVDEAMGRDSGWLKSQSLIDYSLIVGQKNFISRRCGGMWEPYCVAPVCHDQQGENKGDYFKHIFDSGCVDVSYKMDQASEQKQWMAVKDFYCTGEGKQLQLGNSVSRDTCIGTIGKGEERVSFACFGIIDMLKHWEFKVKVERFIKGGGTEISPQNPQFYKERFDKYIKEHVFHPRIGDDERYQFKPTLHSCQYWGQREKAEKDSWVLRHQPYSNLTMVVLATGSCLALAIIGCTVSCIRSLTDSKAEDEKAFSDEKYSMDASSAYGAHNPYQDQAGYVDDGYKGAFGMPPSNAQQPPEYVQDYHIQDYGPGHGQVISMQGMGSPMPESGYGPASSGYAPASMPAEPNALPPSWRADLPDARPHSTGMY